MAFILYTLVSLASLKVRRNLPRICINAAVGKPKIWLVQPLRHQDQDRRFNDELRLGGGDGKAILSPCDGRAAAYEKRP